ncbi:hypothetical protein [Paenibacillus sp. Leaf72]|uniref:hypothetical protein n=1 Tax=Paenibacillus sp. Leaf72 TaxID=1736234 RepID=UPI0006FF8856|nr:hypothetical protein [Paenibacillus sp. Leaf72]KQO00733.1 hypothetical protein ASF12_18460 [Paenibacillus sp. Leaf72]
MLEFILFMLFSIVEGFGILYLMLKIYRYDAASFYPALLVVTLMSLQSFFLREELSLESIVPVINIFVFVIFLSVVIKIPFFAALIITGLGYFIFASIQGAIVNTIPFFSLAEIKVHPYIGYLLQVITAGVNLSIAWGLNRMRIGFMESISEKMRFPHEQRVVGGFIIVILLGFGFILHQRSELLNIIYYFLAALFFFVYSYLKEVKPHGGNYFEKTSNKH